MFYAFITQYWQIIEKFFSCLFTANVAVQFRYKRKIIFHLLRGLNWYLLLIVHDYMYDNNKQFDL